MDIKGTTIRSKIIDYGLIFFLLFFIIIHLSDWSGNSNWERNNIFNPYYDYYQNTGIKLIYFLTFILNTTLIILIVFQINYNSLRTANTFINIILVIATFLICFELWYGSTFYYGEVRDKQGLPFGVNNLGLVGSIFFLSYMILKMKFRLENKYKIIFIKSSLIFLNILLQILLVKYLEETWNLWQS